MNPGQLDRLITVQALTETRDAGGGVVSAWTSLSPKIWAKRVDRGGREFRTSAALTAEVTSMFTLYTYPGLTTKHRFLDDGVTYDLVAVPQASRTGMIEVQAKATNP